MKVAFGRQQGRTCAVALGKRGSGGFERLNTRVGVSEEAKARSMIKRAAYLRDVLGVMAGSEGEKFNGA